MRIYYEVEHSKLLKMYCKMNGVEPKLREENENIKEFFNFTGGEVQLKHLIHLSAFVC